MPSPEGEREGSRTEERGALQGEREQQESPTNPEETQMWLYTVTWAVTPEPVTDLRWPWTLLRENIHSLEMRRGNIQ